MRKKTRLWSFALAGALAISNLSVVAAPYTGIVAAAKVKVDQQKTGKAYVTEIAAKTGFDGKNADGNPEALEQKSLTISIKAHNGYDSNGTVLTEAGKECVPVAFELRTNDGKALYHGGIDGKETAVEAIITNKTASVDEGNYVKTLGGTYKVVLYYGTYNDTVDDDVKTGEITDRTLLHEVDGGQSFSIYKVEEITKAAVKTTYYVLEGDKHTITGNGSYTSSADSNSYSEGVEVEISADTTFEETTTVAATLNMNTGLTDKDKKPVVIDRSVGRGTTVKLTDLSYLNGMNGKIFMGWDTDSEAKTVVKKAGDPITVDDTTVNYYHRRLMP